MGELASLAVLAAVAAALLVRRTSLPAVAVTAAAPLTGVSAFVMAGVISLALVDTVAPAVLVAVAAAVLGFVAALPGGRRTVRARWWAVPASALAVLAVGAVAAAVPLTRLTPDSLDYLAIADVLLEPDAGGSLRLFDLETRNLTAAILQTLGSLDGRPYAPGVTPVVVVPGLALFAWTAWRGVVERSVTGRRAVGLTGAAVVAALASGRAVYDAFYVNSHGLVMVAVLATVAIGYLSRRHDEPDWLVLAGLAAASVVVARPEGPILAAIALAPVVCDAEVGLRHRLVAGLPAALTGLVWFGAVVWRNHADQVDLSPFDPTVGAVVVSAGLAMLPLAPSIRPVAGAVRWFPTAAVVALVGLTAVGFAGDVAFMEATVEATVVNMVGQGGWGIMWPVLIALLVAGLAAPGFRHEGMLLAPAAGGLALVFASAVLRGDAYRVGTGDSGNRMLAHVVLVVVLYVAVSAANGSSRGGAGDQGEPGVGPDQDGALEAQ